MQFDWMSWNLRAHHVNLGYIRKGVEDSIRIAHLASEDSFDIAFTQLITGKCKNVVDQFKVR